jgi:hypothetical protein
MNTLVKGQSSVYLVEETVEGTFVPEATISEAIEPLEDGLEFQLQREEIERNTLTSTIEAVESRLGLKTATGTIPVEFKAAATAGEAPRGQILFESLLGGKRQIAFPITTKTGNTTTVLQIEDEDIDALNVGDCILVKRPGDFAVRPILSKDTTLGSATITLAIPLPVLPGNNVVIEKATTYFHDKDSKSFSVVHYVGGEIKETIWGVKSISASLEGWTANETPSFNFAVEGIDMARTVGAPTLTPDFSGDAKVPVIQGACAWIGQEEVDYTELSLSIENTKADLLSACSPSGKIGTRKTAFTVTASINPYMSDANVDRWNKFEQDMATSLFAYAYNPTATAGEFNQVVAMWIPNAKITNMPTADADGVLMDAIELKAFRNLGNDTIFMSFI